MTPAYAAPRPSVIGPTVLVAVAALLVRLVVTGEYANFVKPVMAPFLVASAVFLAALAVGGLLPRAPVAGARHDDEHSNDEHSNDGHSDHAHLPRVAWLLLCPVLIVVFAAPTSLGSYTAAQTDTPPAPPPIVAGGYEPLPPGDPLGLPLADYAERAAYGGESTLEGRRFSLLGFVSPGPTPDTWYATRLQMQCCASDAAPIKVLAVGAPPRPNDAWVVITGPYRPAGPDGIPQLQVTSVEDTEEPEYPYVFG